MHCITSALPHCITSASLHKLVPHCIVIMMPGVQLAVFSSCLFCFSLRLDNGAYNDRAYSLWTGWSCLLSIHTAIIMSTLSIVLRMMFATIMSSNLQCVKELISSASSSVTDDGKMPGFTPVERVSVERVNVERVSVERVSVGSCAAVMTANSTGASQYLPCMQVNMCLAYYIELPITRLKQLINKKGAREAGWKK